MPKTTSSPGKPHVSAWFKAVARLFNDIQGEPHELGSALCIYLNGEPVVDLWGGPMSPAGAGVWRRDTDASILYIRKSLTADT